MPSITVAFCPSSNNHVAIVIKKQIDGATALRS